MLIKILFNKNYPGWIKSIIDFCLLTIIFYLTNQIIDLPILYSDCIGYLAFPLCSVFILSIFKTYNVIYRYFNVKNIYSLMLGLVLSSLTFFIIAGNFNKTQYISHLLLFFFLFFFWFFFE